MKYEKYLENEKKKKKIPALSGEYHNHIQNSQKEETLMSIV